MGFILPNSLRKDKGLSARELFRRLIDSPFFKERVENDGPVERLKGRLLPLAENRRTIHGNGFVLVGDAAGLANPLWGHGIDAAMVSGKIAARVAAEACRDNDFAATRLQAYPDALYRLLKPGSRRCRSFRKRLEQPLSFPFATPLEKFHRFFFAGQNLESNRSVDIRRQDRP